MKRSIVIASIGILSVIAPQTRAALIEIAIEAEVDWVHDEGEYLEGNINAGDSIIGTYYYYSDVLNSYPPNEDWHGLYEYSDHPCGIYLEAGKFIFKTNPDNVDFRIYVINDSPTLGEDNFNIRSYNNLPLSNGADVGWIVWQIIDDSMQAISSIDLPLNAPLLSNWTDGNSLRIEGVPRETVFVIESHVVSAILVPEPTSIIILTIGCLCICKRKCKTKL